MFKSKCSVKDFFKFGSKSCDSNVNESSSKGKCCCWRAILMLLVNIAIASAVCVAFMYSPLFIKASKRYMMHNPDDIIASLEKKEAELQKKSAENRKKIKEEAPIKAKEIAKLAESSTAFIGSANAKNILVMFYDYNCGFCKKLSMTLKDIVGKNLKVVLVEFPILSQESAFAAKASMYVADKHPTLLGAFHFELIEKDKVNRDSILAVAKKLNISVSEITVAMDAESYDDRLRANYKDAVSLGADGTPISIINGKLFVGYLSAEKIKAAMV